jgi:hypothetical protein
MEKMGGYENKIDGKIGEREPETRNSKLETRLTGRNRRDYKTI